MLPGAEVMIRKSDRKKILIVDDESINLGMLAGAFDTEDYELIFSQDGTDALNKAQSENPDLVLLDVVMPGIDGFETCHQLKAHRGTMDIPVIFMTALHDIEDKVKGFRAGGADFITKPIQLDELFARVNVHISLYDAQSKLKQKNKELELALKEIKTLKGILPICMHCKEIRDDQGYWNKIEVYIEEHSSVEFTHSLCEKCLDKYYPEDDEV